MGIFSKKSKQPDVVLSIPEMSCGHCEKKITEALSQVDGVRNVSADAKAKEARIFGSASAEQLIQALEPTPYSGKVKE